MSGGFPVPAVVAVRASYQVDVAQLVQPEVVDGRGEAREVVGLERGVAEGDGGAQPRQNPPVGDALLAAQLTTQVESMLVSLARCLFMEVYGCQVFTTGPFLFASLCSHLGLFHRYKVLSQRPHGELDSVPQFVAEVAVAQDTVDVQVDVPACGERVGRTKN